MKRTSAAAPGRGRHQPRPSTRHRAGLGAIAWLLIAAIGGCEDEHPALGEAGWSRAERGTQAVLLVRDELLAVGEVTELVVAVQTEPRHRVRPWPPPEIPGVDILSHQSETEELRGGRWLHRTRIRLRPRSAGAITWPDASLVIEDPDGGEQRLELPGRELEARSILTSQRVDRQPYGLRRLEPAGGAGFLPGLIAGGIATLAAVWLRRRSRLGARASPRRAPRPAREPLIQQPTGPERTRSDLARARQVLEERPREASNIGAASLRSFVADHFDMELRAATTDELERSRPRAVQTAFWSEFVRLLRRYDAERFQRHAGGDPAVEHVRACLDETDAFIDLCSPPRGAAP